MNKFIIESISTDNFVWVKNGNKNNFSVKINWSSLKCKHNDIWNESNVISNEIRGWECIDKWIPSEFLWISQEH